MTRQQDKEICTFARFNATKQLHTTMTFMMYVCFYKLIGQNVSELEYQVFGIKHQVTSCPIKYDGQK